MVKTYLKKYFVTAMGAMAQGLFATLLVGTILNTIGKYAHIGFLVEISSYAQSAYVVGAIIGVAVAYSLKADMLVMLSSGVVGAIGYMLGITKTIVQESGEEAVKSITAGPAGAFFAVIIACEIAKFVSKKTKVDILVTPTVTILIGFGASKLLCPAIAYIMYYLGQFINVTTNSYPFVFGIIISVVVGMILTLPISSAAVCAMIGISGIAGGAAAVGCCCQMVGFAVMSFRENRFGGLVSQGLGTSMLQMGNICKNPKIWIPPTLTAAILGPLATCVFKLQCSNINAGMGTCGLVGPIGIILDSPNNALTWIGLILLCFVLPAALTFAFSEIMRKIGWIKENDLRLDDTPATTETTETTEKVSAE